MNVTTNVADDLRASLAMRRLMTTAIAERPALDPNLVATVLLTGDLEKLTDPQRLSYMTRICDILGINSLTQPFAFIRLNGKLVMYAKKDCAEQLRNVHEISIDPKGFTREVIEGCYVVTAPASMPSGRTDVATGAVAIDGLKGEARANAMMKAETKAKRRVTLSICGLGMLDETEVESIAPLPTVTAAPIKSLPAGTFSILTVTPTEWGGSVKVLDEHGAEADYVCENRQTFELAEQIAQEGKPAVLKLAKGARSGKVKVKEVHRWQSPEEQQAKAENAALDAEIAKQQPEPAL